MTDSQNWTEKLIWAHFFELFNKRVRSRWQVIDQSELQ